VVIEEEGGQRGVCEVKLIKRDSLLRILNGYIIEMTVFQGI
jgi:hypothetical protein